MSCSADSKGRSSFLLDRFGVGVPAHRDVAREDRLVALEDIDVDGAGAGVEQHDDAAGREPVVHFERVLKREGIHVDDHRRPSGLRDDTGVVADLILLRGDQQDIHAPARVWPGPGVEDLIVEVHVLDVERDVLFRLPGYRLIELRLGHHRQRDTS